MTGALPGAFERIQSSGMNSSANVARSTKLTLWFVNSTN